MYALWKPAGVDAAEFCQQLRGPVQQALLKSGVRNLRLNLVDAEIAPAEGLRQVNSRPAWDALVSMWVDTAIRRSDQEAVLAGCSERFHGYLVTESEPIVNDKHPAEPGQRVAGMNQVVFLQRPQRLSYQHWLDIWHGSHTQVAIDTQSTFGYRQNVIVRPLTYAAPHYDAIIEENFPAAAMTSQPAFYEAEGDDDKFKRNLQAMMDSCARFIDFDKIDVIPTSEYNFEG